MLAIGDIRLDADEVGDYPAAVAHRRDGEFVPEGGAVFAVVFQNYFAVMLFFQGHADLIDGSAIGIRALQEAAVLPDYFAAIVACNPLESPVAVYYRLVRPGSVRDRDAVAGSCQRAIVQPKYFFY